MEETVEMMGETMAAWTRQNPANVLVLVLVEETMEEMMEEETLRALL